MKKCFEEFFFHGKNAQPLFPKNALECEGNDKNDGVGEKGGSKGKL